MPRSAFDSFCRECFDFLRLSDVRHLVIGGLAVVAVGEPRTTGDVDVVAFLNDAEADDLIGRAQTAGFEPDSPLERERLRETGTLRFRRGRFHLDIILASLPFEEAAYERGSLMRLFGRRVRLPTPEDLILFKVLAGREKDLLDAIGIIRRHRDGLDWGYVERVVRELSDLAEDVSPWQRLQSVRRKASS